MSTLVGYARVSTHEQDTATQERALRAAGAVRVFVDHATSSRRADRPQWLACLDYLRPGDTLLVWRLDRLAGTQPQALTLADFDLVDLRQTGDYYVVVADMEKRLDELNASYLDLQALIDSAGSGCNNIPAIQPVINKQLTLLTASYGMRIHPFYKTLQSHQGVDYTIPEGSRVFATADGVVRELLDQLRRLEHPGLAERASAARDLLVRGVVAWSVV